MRKYIIGCGWYTESEEGYTRKGVGHPFSRSLKFVEIWKELLFRYADPARVVMVNSASPVIPPPDSRIEFISLDKNYQYCGTYFTGWMRGFLTAAIYAWMCDSDFIYVEQDCIVMGKGWVGKIQALAEKHQFEQFHPGLTRNRSSWPMQVSVIYVPYEQIMEVVYGISSPDNPAPWRKTPEGRRPVDEMLLTHCGVPWTSHQFGYGRRRPINWDDEILYVQHWTKEDLEALADREGVKIEFRPA